MEEFIKRMRRYVPLLIASVVGALAGYYVGMNHGENRAFRDLPDYEATNLLMLVGVLEDIQHGNRESAEFGIGMRADAAVVMMMENATENVSDDARAYRTMALRKYASIRESIQKSIIKPRDMNSADWNAVEETRKRVTGYLAKVQK